MSLERKEQSKIEIPPHWRSGILLNCPYYLSLKGHQSHSWDNVYFALQQATDSSLNHINQGPCRRPCETSGPTASHNILLTRGPRSNNKLLGRIINSLVESMPEIEITWQ